MWSLAGRWRWGREGRPIREVAAEETNLSDEELTLLLDPAELAKGGVKG